MGTLRQTIYPVVLCRCCIAFVTVCWAASLASAVPITINNHSFEDKIFRLGHYGNGIQAWTVYGGTDVGTWRPTTAEFNLSTLDGDQIAYLHTGGSAAQQLSTGLVLGQKYHLSALLGALSSGLNTKGGSLQLWAGGTVASGNVVGGTILGSLSVADNQLTPGLFLPFSTEITAPSSGPLRGELLSVRFVSNGVEAELDNVQLDVEETPSDFDYDGDVDGRDFLIWQRGGSPYPLSASDLADWRSNFGTGLLAATNVAVPEPCTVSLLMLVMAGRLVRNRTA
ncbi:hypothetical protein [Lacipirellula limnantheis]|uniref:PEP-CTERM protein-sorting domain-containing protein n=1 Tax=Lacipirellula limnantheis TaxID=2528024 RepID=A0A517TYC0_9BACT|nr:hypothetical protein [Lacipirellula limnantheis]QDT73370.1 hypothetical protein I41_25590 [Lacipirellula limnantheis]